MLDDLTAASSGSSMEPNIPLLPQRLVKCCHVQLPDTPKPTSAIVYQGRFYAYVKRFPTLEAAQRGAQRLVQRGNAVVLTQIPKGAVVWVLELDAQPVTTIAVET